MSLERRDVWPGNSSRDTEKITLATWKPIQLKQELKSEDLGCVDHEKATESEGGLIPNDKTGGRSARHEGVEEKRTVPSIQGLWVTELSCSK
jgi:hypothetical protein